MKITPGIRARASGFTLIELLIVVAMIGTLSALVVPALNSAQTGGKMAREVSAARQMMTGYHLYATEHDGALLPGYGNFPATDEQGNVLGNPVNRRYPWRLAPYLQYDFRALYVNDGAQRLLEYATEPRASYVYSLSVTPSLGINSVFVGGDEDVLPPNNANVQAFYGDVCVTRMARAKNPSQLVVFASACGNLSGKKVTGYFKIEPPNLAGRQWDTTYNPSRYEAYGHVDFRYNDRAVVAMLDGHVEALAFDQLQDMRRWSSQAAEADNPNWMLIKN